MTDETLWLDTVLGPQEAAEVRGAIAATAAISAKGLSIAPSALLTHAIEGSVAAVLHIDVLAFLAEGWTFAQDIKAYGDPTLHPPGTTAILKLGKHDIERDLRPVITIDLGGPKRFPVDLAISLIGTFRGVEISIRDSAIIAVGSGTVDLTAGLELAKQKIWSKTFANWRIPGAHQFATPVKIPFVG